MPANFTIDAWIVRGTAAGITHEDHFVGDVEFVPRTDGGAELMKPVQILIDENERQRKAGMMEIPVLSKFDRQLRTVLFLGKREANRIRTLRPGEDTVIPRTGWGRTWENHVKKTINS